MPKSPDFRSSLVTIWFRFLNLSILSLVFVEVMILAKGKAQGWSFFLTLSEVGFEVVVRLVTAALAGVVLGTACTVVIAPFLALVRSSRDVFVQWTSRIAAGLAAFLVFRFALTTLINSVHALSIHGLRFRAVLYAAYYLAFAALFLIPRTRKEVVTSLDGFLGRKMSRRAALATVVGTAALVTTEYVLSKKTSRVRAAVGKGKRPKSNLLLITFDAFSAEDVSLYGYRLSTTPNIDAFAKRATVFTNFYSGSTFTTPCIATMLTGQYPSETRVYQLEGRIRGRNTVPHMMADSGFATGAFFSNSNAYYLAQGLEEAYNLLPLPVYQAGGLQRLWEATTPLHQDTGVGNRMDEYMDLMVAWNGVAGLPNSLYVRYRAAASFEHARQMLSNLPDGFFLWVHVMTPHSPYLPDAVDQGRFLSPERAKGFDNDEAPAHWLPHYAPDQQAQVDGRRLLYDEFVLTADRAFGEFMTGLETSGKLQNTTVIVSADHGESFQGGVFQHQSPYQTRPVIHVPLIIRTPGQQDGSRVEVVADQTSLAPTILEMAEQPIPAWMRGPSLVPWLGRDGQGQGQGLAFCQYLERNSIFKPVRHGTVGVIDGRYQYLVYIDDQKGVLRPLAESQIWNLDRSAEFPEQAKALRQKLNERFPDLVQITT
jgi:arylsulfatase A-like enzyme